MIDFSPFYLIKIMLKQGRGSAGTHTHTHTHTLAVFVNEATLSSISDGIIDIFLVSSVS